MTTAEPLYSSQVDPEFEALVDEPTATSSSTVSVSPRRHRGDAVENAKAALLFKR